MSEFKILGRKIGYNYDPLVIAEIGINHEGSLSVACEMAQAAIDAGAEIIKHQTHIIEDEMSAEAKSVIPGNSNDSIYDIMSRCALNEEDESYLKNFIEERGAIFISTPFSRAAVDRLERLEVPAYKIGSGECNNYPLIRYIAAKGKPVILSTGMNSIDSVSEAVRILREFNVPYALLHTTNVYPTPPHLIRLGGVQQLLESFPDAIVGLSDHSESNLACLGAVAVGASILERHFTDRIDRSGPDIACSMDPDQLRELISASISMKQMRGGEKGLAAEEEVTAKFAYASVVTITEVKKGEVFSEDNLWVKRPGTGDFLAENYESLLGRIAACDIENGCQLKYSDLV